MKKAVRHEDLEKSAPLLPPNNNKKITLKTIGIPLTLAVLLVLFNIPTPEGLSIQGLQAIAIFCAALILCVCGSLPIYLISMIVIVLLPLTGAVAKEKVVFGTLGYDGICFCINFGND